MKDDIRSARVLSVNASKEGSWQAVIAIGSDEKEITWDGTPPEVGDIFRVVNGKTPTAKDRIGASLPGSWSKDCDALRWRRRDAGGKSRMDIIALRHRIKRTIRDYMDSEGFIEIDSPLLVHGTTPDTAIDSFAWEDRFLVTSTEYQIKRMEIGGFDKTYTMTQNYRLGDDTSPHRNPEFTMIEWARVGDTLASIEADAEQMAWRAHKALGGGEYIDFQGHKIRLAPPWQRMSVSDAIQKYVGIGLPDFSLDSIKAAVEKAGIEIKAEWAEDRAFLFSLIMDHIQQFLGFEHPVFICDWPSFQTSSAPGMGGNDTVERSELFVAGIEISDGFPTLTSYERQVTAFANQLALREKAGQPEARLDEAYLEAMKIGIPSGAGMALGFDRLVMLLTNQTSIKRVLAFAWDEV